MTQKRRRLEKKKNTIRRKRELKKQKLCEPIDNVEENTENVENMQNVDIIAENGVQTENTKTNDVMEVVNDAEDIGDPIKIEIQ